MAVGGAVGGAVAVAVAVAVPPVPVLQCCCVQQWATVCGGVCGVFNGRASASVGLAATFFHHTTHRCAAPADTCTYNTHNESSTAAPHLVDQLVEGSLPAQPFSNYSNCSGRWLVCATFSR